MNLITRNSIQNYLKFSTFLTLTSIINLSKMSSSQTCSSLDQKEKDFYSLTYVTINTEQNAVDLAKSILDKELAACVNILPNIRSLYKWKSELQDDKEQLMMIKSKYSKIDNLTNFIKKNHPYEVCEVITVPIKHGNIEYLKWIDENVSDTVKN